MITIIFTVIALICSAAVFFSNYPLTVRRENLGGTVRAVHVSDLHKRRFGRDNSRLIASIKAEKPDFIVISGDAVTRDETDFSCIKSTLDALCRIAPVFMCSGNHEQSLPQEYRGKFYETVAETQVKMLRNTSAEIVLNGRKLRIFGLEEDYGVYKKGESYRNLDVLTADVITELLGESPDDGEVLLMAHNPFFGEAYSQWGASYTFSGHVHGGAVRLFGIGILSPERKLFPKCSKGVYVYGGMKLLVSAGLGKIRLFNPPEIVVYEI